LQVVILAGGLGTRLRPLTLQVPKALVEVAGEPFIDYQIKLLKKNRFRDFVICVGYKSDLIEKYLGNGDRFGVSIVYSNDGEKQLGPAGALKNASPLLKNEFMVTYGDSYLQMDYAKFEESFHSSGKLGMMAVFENRNAYGKSDIVVREGLVTLYNKINQSPEMLWINYGATMLQKVALHFIPDKQNVGEEEFYRFLIENRELGAFPTFTRFYEVGTLSGLNEFERFVMANRSSP